MSEKAKETIVSSTEKAANGISTITGAIKQTASAKTGSTKNNECGSDKQANRSRQREKKRKQPHDT